MRMARFQVLLMVGGENMHDAYSCHCQAEDCQFTSSLLCYLPCSRLGTIWARASHPPAQPPYNFAHFALHRSRKGLHCQMLLQAYLVPLPCNHSTMPSPCAIICPSKSHWYPAGFYQEVSIRRFPKIFHNGFQKISII